jgi:hypothetical protein
MSSPMPARSVNPGLRDATAIVGIGETAFYKRGPSHRQAATTSIPKGGPRSGGILIPRF